VKKGTLLIPSGTPDDPDKRHLFVVLNDPAPDTGCVLLASFSTYRTDIYCDGTCVIEEGESGHTFLRVKSFVRYQKLRFSSEAQIQAGISSGTFDEREALSDELFERVRQGVFDSPFSAKKFKKFLARHS